MKKAFLTLAAVLTSVLAMSQFYVYKGGHLLYEIEDGIADSVTFVKPDYLGFENGYEWVDLGLTSGTRWAAMNVGANKAEDYGNYYAWGETTTKESYKWSDYLDGNIKHKEEDCGTDKDLLNGVTDIAGTQYDAAKANWGGKWRMATYDQQTELRSECYWVWTESYNGSNVSGYIVYKAKSESDKGVKVYASGTPSSSYSLSDAHIFLPQAGRYSENGYINDGGYYISSTLKSDQVYYAWRISINSGHASGNTGGNRNYGWTVRAVIPGE